MNWNCYFVYDNQRLVFYFFFSKTHFTKSQLLFLWLVKFISLIIMLISLEWFFCCWLPNLKKKFLKTNISLNASMILCTINVRTTQYNLCTVCNFAISRFMIRVFMILWLKRLKWNLLNSTLKKYFLVLFKKTQKKTKQKSQIDKNNFFFHKFYVYFCMDGMCLLYEQTRVCT